MSIKLFKFKLTRKILHLGSKVARLKLNRIGGNLFKRWNMWFNAIIHA